MPFVRLGSLSQSMGGREVGIGEHISMGGSLEVQELNS